MINIRVDSGRYSKQSGYGAIGILITLSGTLGIVMSVIYMVKSRSVMKILDVFFNTYTFMKSTWGTSFILYMTASCLAFLNGWSVLLVNQTIRHAGSLLINSVVLGCLIAWLASGESLILIGV
jgi:hypothetical protein